MPTRACALRARRSRLDDAPLLHGARVARPAGGLRAAAAAGPYSTKRARSYEYFNIYRVLVRTRILSVFMYTYSEIQDQTSE